MGKHCYLRVISLADPWVVVLAVQLLLFAVLLGVTCLLCHSSDSEMCCLTG